jgi:hypothetical protein
MGSADMGSAEMNCAGLAEVASELALGVLTGRERAQAVAHLDRCDACREDVRQLMATSEGLLTLLPSREPPAGFETRVLDRLGLPATADSEAAGRETVTPLRYRHARPRRAPGARGSLGARRLAAAAAVALAVVGAGVGGWGIGSASSPGRALPAPAPASLNSAALLTASHKNVGQVFVYQGVKDQGGQQWMYMSVNLPSGDGTVTCQVVGEHGQVTTVGSFRLADGYGAWASAGPWGSGTVDAARLLAPDGTVLATATFTQGYVP